MYPFPSINKDSGYSLHQLHEFFDYYGFHAAVKLTGMQLAAALQHKAYRQQEPYAMLWLHQHLTHLVNAAFVLSADYPLRNRFIIPLAEKCHPDLTITSHYMGTHKPLTPWQYFPRHLTAEQYSNPMLVLTAFTKYKTQPEWNNVLAHLLEYSLSNASIHGIQPPINFLKIRLLLLQLVEAAHLILVRSRLPSKSTDD